MSDEVVISLTTPAGDGSRIARALVEQRLAACVNVLPAVQSVYRWQGAIEEAEECLLLVKTRREHAETIDAALRELHPYEVYELIVLPIDGGNEAYLAWIRDSVA